MSMFAILKNKIMTMIQKIKVTNSEKHKFGEYPRMQISGLGKISDNTEIIHPYGFASQPPVDATGVKFNIQGEESNQVAMAYDPATLPAYEVKEVVVGAFSAPSPTYLKFTKAGTIEVWRNGILVIADLITHLHNPSDNTTPLDPNGIPVPPL